MSVIARIEGDHSHYHAGSAAVMQGLRRVLEENGFQVAEKDGPYDVMVMNGEGSMHHGRPTFHKKMKLLTEALDAGKPAYLVNSVWEDNPPDYNDVLRGLSGISVREVLSQSDLLERHGVQSRVVPDLCMYAPLPRFCWWRNFRGSPAMTDFYIGDGEPGVGRFRRDNTILPEAKRLRLKKISWGNAVKSLRTARFLITGRQHGVYAACRARIPFAASKGNTHKIEALIQSAGANIPVASHPAEIRDIIPRLPDLQAEFTKLFNWLEAQDYCSILPRANERH